MIGVTWSGAVYTVDSTTGTSTLAAPGLFGQNCLARDAAGDLWTVSRTFLGTPIYYLTQLDASSLELQAVTVCPDVRALADAGNDELYAMEFQVNGYQLSRIHKSTGARTVIGNTGEAIHGMAMHQGVLYAYGANSGLGTIDPMTGEFTDAGPFGGNSNIQWLAVRPDGQLIGGGYGFYTIDTQSGATVNYSPGNPTANLAGVQASGMALPFGSGCEGIELRANGQLTAGSLLTTHSVGYPSTGAVVGMAGVMIIGSSNTSHNNIPLPIDLDPLLGTTGCSLYVSVDVTAINFTTGSTAPSLFFPFTLPAGLANRTIYLQHAGFDFTGASYWSNALRVRIGA
jgi:hypothetical protein